MKVGIDVLDVKRMEKLVENESFLVKNFTSYEIKYLNKKKFKDQTLAGLFCAKESFLKALGIGIKNGIQLNEIEVNHDENGKPYYNLSDNVKTILNDLKVKNIDLSISHTDSIATAICVMN